MPSSVRDRVLVGLLREEAAIRWVNARDVAARADVSAGTVGQALIRLRADQLVEGREIAQHIRQWRLTDEGERTALGLLPRRRGMLGPEARELAADGTLTLSTPVWTVRAQMMDPQKLGFPRRRDQFGRVGPSVPPRRRRTMTDRRRVVEMARSRRQRVSRRLLFNMLGSIEKRHQMEEIERTLEAMAADGELIRNDDGSYQLAARTRQESASETWDGEKLLRTIWELSAGPGWASTRDVAQRLGVDGRSLRSGLEYLTEIRGWLERWKPGQTGTFHRLTASGRQQLGV